MKQNNKIYIAGKVTGDPDYKVKFNDARYRIESARKECSTYKQCQECIFYDRDYVTMCRISDLFPKHFEFVNPAKFEKVEKWPWLLAMVYCLFKMRGCTYVFFLKDWKESKGARWEHRQALRWKKRVIYE